MRFFKHRLIIPDNAEPIPPLLDLRIIRVSKVVTLINFGQSIVIQVAPFAPEFVQKYQLGLLRHIHKVFGVLRESIQAISLCIGQLSG